MTCKICKTKVQTVGLYKKTQVQNSEFYILARKIRVERQMKTEATGFLTIKIKYSKLRHPLVSKRITQLKTMDFSRKRQKILAISTTQ